jgi:hypothetical protein
LPNTLLLSVLIKINARSQDLVVLLVKPVVDRLYCVWKEIVCMRVALVLMVAELLARLGTGETGASAMRVIPVAIGTEKDAVRIQGLDGCGA